MVATLAACLIMMPLVLGHDLDRPTWTLVCIAARLLLALAFVPIERRIAALGVDPLVKLNVTACHGNECRTGAAPRAFRAD